ncbi:HET-domain-containing protein [Stipitochalara longipes BDJ]|nr:HET-domain-containing protein [Stipitochalara longipes BDJ]
MCKLLVDAIHRRFWGDVSHVTKEPQTYRFSLRSDPAGQYIDIGSWMVGIVDGRKIPDGFEDKKSSRSPDSELETIQQWLDVCQNAHESCRTMSKSPYVPTRLVKVDLPSKDQVQLVQIKQERVTDRRYLALSHCWGLNMPRSALTTIATLPERLLGINVSELPQTFRDAINIARQLSVPYIWIDSMCIIQDSNEDWEKEAADMTSVYSEAFLTIAATSSTNSNEGCRTDPGSILIGPVVLEFPIADRENSSPIQKVRIFPSDDYLYNFRSQPLLQRGWTLQERELSTRILFYTKETIRWECSCLKASLRYPWDDKSSFYTEVFNHGDARWRDAYSGTNMNARDDIEILWQMMACKFMDRKLTFQSDVLPAISGMAKLAQQSTGDQYLAGLWKSTLLRGLLWESNWDQNYMTVRPREYLAPSWSWASIIGSIHCFRFNDSNNSVDLSNLGPVQRPKIVEANTEPSGIDPFGRLRNGFIRLEGVLKIAQVRGPKQDTFSISLQVWDDEKKVGDLVYDVFDELPKEDQFEVTCLYFRPRNDNPRNPQPTGLALIPTPKDGNRVYKRVGLLFSIEPTQ